MDSDHHQDNLTAAYIDHTVVIRVEGRGSFKISPPLKNFVLRVINNPNAAHVLIDMSGCYCMDSTFMGVLAGLSFQIKDRPGHTMKLTNLSEKNQKLLITLGVDRVVSYSPTPTPEEAALISQIAQQVETVEEDGTNTLDTARTTLEAHETLVKINPDNLVRFKSVLELLQKDIDLLDG